MLPEGCHDSLPRTGLFGTGASGCAFDTSHPWRWRPNRQGYARPSRNMGGGSPRGRATLSDRIGSPAATVSICSFLSKDGAIQQEIAALQLVIYRHDQIRNAAGTNIVYKPAGDRLLARIEGHVAGARPCSPCQSTSPSEALLIRGSTKERLTALAALTALG